MTNSNNESNFTTNNINLNWDWQQNIGAGLKNLANTCYMNSALQCLTYTAPLSNYLVKREHHTACTRKKFCLTCLMKKHVSLALNTNEVVAPKSFVSNLKKIVSHFTKGTQEDAHEFLQYVLEGIQNSCSSSRESNNIVHQVFGGCLRSSVKCLRCNAVSDTYEQCMCIQLEIKKAKSINQALEQFIDPEVLGGKNCYKCSSCNTMTTAVKGYSIHQTPNVLTLSLQRFDNLSMTKIRRKIQYPEFINIRPYTSSSDGKPVTYSLYAVLVHAGTSCNSGHYYCFVKAPNRKWFKMNDESVNEVNMKTVLNQQAYLLFYIRTENPKESKKIINPHPSTRTKRPRSETLSPVQPPCKSKEKAKKKQKHQYRKTTRLIYESAFYLLWRMYDHRRAPTEKIV
ncbi:hypothetical protein XELAEV_18015164mg [Xenopus laevis]|uniref:Ubiquitin carboxyl-terminal hydrolase n=1 Tax=Xenopus laevis TaxID=8355 RepID=A0A974DHZ6_XENLA|nr:hypothetical protein XELAEV_18015164mg [Xenopus laevis]